MRVPRIEDQHGAALVAAVPSFVLDRIVESERLAFDPFARLPADAEAAAGRNIESEVDDCTGVGDPGVRWNHAAGAEHREESVGRAARNSGQRQGF